MLKFPLLDKLHLLSVVYITKPAQITAGERDSENVKIKDFSAIFLVFRLLGPKTAKKRHLDQFSALLHPGLLQLI